MGRGYCSKCSTIAADIDYWKHECEDTQCSQRGSLYVLRTFSNEYGLRIVVCPVLAEVSPGPGKVGEGDRPCWRSAQYHGMREPEGYRGDSSAGPVRLMATNFRNGQQGLFQASQWAGPGRKFLSPAQTRPKPWRARPEPDPTQKSPGCPNSPNYS